MTTRCAERPASSPRGKPSLPSATPGRMTCSIKPLSKAGIVPYHSEHNQQVLRRNPKISRAADLSRLKKRAREGEHSPRFRRAGAMRSNRLPTQKLGQQLPLVRRHLAEIKDRPLFEAVAGDFELVAPLAGIKPRSKPLVSVHSYPPYLRIRISTNCRQQRFFCNRRRLFFSRLRVESRPFGIGRRAKPRAQSLADQPRARNNTLAPSFPAPPDPPAIAAAILPATVAAAAFTGSIRATVTIGIGYQLLSFGYQNGAE